MIYIALISIFLIILIYSICDYYSLEIITDDKTYKYKLKRIYLSIKINGQETKIRFNKNSDNKWEYKKNDDYISLIEEEMVDFDEYSIILHHKKANLNLGYFCIGAIEIIVVIVILVTMWRGCV